MNPFNRPIQKNSHRLNLMKECLLSMIQNF